MMTLLMPCLKIIFKIICYLAIIPLIGSSIAIIALHFSNNEPDIDCTKKKELTRYWWFDRGYWWE